MSTFELLVKNRALMWGKKKFNEAGAILERAFGQGLGDSTHVVGDVLPAVQENHRDVFGELEVHKHLKNVEGSKMCKR